jgi:hypothetical protein
MVPQHRAAALVHRHGAACAVPHSTCTHTVHHDSFRIQSSRAAEEEVFRLEIRQPDGVRYVEYPLTRWHRSKYGSRTSKKIGREVAHRGNEGRALQGTPSIHFCQTLLLGGCYIGGWGRLYPPPPHQGI